MSSIIMMSCGIGKKDIKPQRHEGTEIRKIAMEQIINIHIEKLPKGLYAGIFRDEYFRLLESM